ncbi:hypothetical protein [Geomonas azotofigens]|uniref:hypothetical protein n=1 Tax=Geomonas azotofigens TaxID=2843196 RepID=UPI001C0F61F0|nr:hypothetical protein [Geomonas azotofigens]MBU5613316.1 hypothetical protein [Geomonas azotofigens]
MLRRLSGILVLVVFLFAIGGCGSGGDSGTNGTLTLAASSNLVAGTHVVTASAVYSNTTAKKFQGIPITFTYTARSASGVVQTASYTAITDDSGTAYDLPRSFTQINEAIAVTIIATVDGLRSAPTIIELSAL